MRKLIKWFFNLLYKVRPPEMVQYWKSKEMARAKVVHAPDGSLQMQIEGEKYLFPGFPRGHVIMTTLAELKYQIKNVIFNDVWAKLESSESEASIINELRGPKLNFILQEIEKCRHDMVPPERMVISIRELYRAMTSVIETLPSYQDQLLFNKIRDGLCFFLEEDDAYRFRFQWLATYINPNMFLKRLYRIVRFKRYNLKDDLELGMKFLENAEIVPDMKARTLLIKRVVSLILKDPQMCSFIEQVFKRINWKKVYLSNADKYYFRGKYFKVDHDKFDY